MTIIVIGIVITTIVLVISKKNKEKEVPFVEEEKSEVYSLPSTKYSDMEVTNVVMKYLKNNNETMISMQINNTTSKKVEKENLEAILINSDEEVIGRIQTHIEKLDVGKQYNISVVLKGDLTSTKQIKLEKK